MFSFLARLVLLLFLMANLSMIADNKLVLQDLSDEEFGKVSELMRELGKINRRDLFVPVARLQLLHVLQRLETSDLPESKLIERKKFARGIAFNIASFTWPGWDDTPNITPELEQLGEDAAALGLQIAEEIDDVTPNILWINGVHALNAGNFDRAKKFFVRANSIARNDLGEDMHNAWIRCTEFLEYPTSETETAFQQALDKLSNHQEDGTFFRSQIETAVEVFQRN